MKYKYFFKLIFCKYDFFKIQTLFFLLFVALPVFLLQCLAGYFGDIFDKNEKYVKEMTGNWHMAYILEKEDSILEVEKMPEVFGVGKVFCIREYDASQKNEYTILGGNIETQKMMIHLVEGRYAKYKDEIIVPNYISREYNLKINDQYILGNQRYHISGIYASEKGEIVYYANINIAKSDMHKKTYHEFIYGNYHDQVPIEKSMEEKYLAVVRLVNGIDLKKTSKRIEAVDGVRKFPWADSYGITYDSKETFWYNGDLLQVQEFYNGGYLVENSYRFQKCRLLFLITFVTVITAYLFLCVYNICVSRETNKKLEIYISFGIKLFDVIILQVLQKIVYAFGFFFVGSIMGKWFVGTVCQRNYSLQNIAVFAMFLMLLIYMIMTVCCTIKRYYQQDIKNSFSLLYYDNMKCNEKATFHIRGRRFFIFYYAIRNATINMAKSAVIFSFCFVIFIWIAVIFSEYKYAYYVGDGSQANYDMWLDIKQKRDVDHVVSSVSEIEGIYDVIAPMCYVQDYKNHSKEVVTKLDKSKVNKVLYKSLLMSDYEEYIKFSSKYILTHTGIIGCNANTIHNLEDYVIEGDINKLNMKGYIFLPQYYEGYEKMKSDLTSYKIGDKIEIGFDYNNQENIKLLQGKEFEIAGFIKYNPYKCGNGVSSAFSVLMSEYSLKNLLKNEKKCFSNKIYLRYSKKEEYHILSQLNEMKREGFKYTVNLHSDELANRVEASERIMIYYLLWAVIVISIVYFMIFLWSKNLNRKDEYWVLYSIGFEKRHIKMINCLEFFFPAILSVPIGFIAYYMILDWLHPEILTFWGEIVTYRDISGIALFVFLFGGWLSWIGLGRQYGALPQNKRF